MQRILYNYDEAENIPQPRTSIYLAKSDKILTDMSITDTAGEFEFLNPITPLAIIGEMNDNTTITHNLDQPDPKILYSALLTTLDPSDPNDNYIENVDVVELIKLAETDQ